MEHPLVPPRVRKSGYKYRINLALVKERIAQSQIVLAHSGIEREFRLRVSASRSRGRRGKPLIRVDYYT